MKRKRRDWLSQVGYIVLDAILINVAFVLAHYIRYEREVGGNVESTFYLPLASFWPMQVAITLAVAITLVSNGLYVRRRGRSLLDEAYVVASSALLAITGVLFVYLIFRPVLPSRLLFAYTLVLLVALLTTLRWGVRLVEGSLRRRGIGVERVLVVGAGEVGRTVIQNIIAQPELGLRIVGFVDDDPAKHTDIGRTLFMGVTGEIARIVDENRIDVVIVTLPWLSHEKVMGIIAHCQRSSVEFRIVPDLFQLSLSRVNIDDLNGVPLLGLKDVTFSSSQRVIKRVIDILGATAALILLSPLLTLSAILIKLDSPGPVLFRQTRVGRGGKHFTVYKFRTMVVNAEHVMAALQAYNEAGGVTFKMKDDPRRTRVGKWLRRFSIDEMPQFYNVLRGEMSLVGPRPPLPSEVERYEDWHMRRLEVSPGLTGLWQVRGRSDIPFPEMVMLDVYYIENWSLAMDIRIMLETLPTLVLARGAY